MKDHAPLSPREECIAAALAQAVIAEVRRLNESIGNTLVAGILSIVDPGGAQEPPHETAPDGEINSARRGVPEALDERGDIRS